MKKQSLIILTAAAIVSSAFTMAVVWKADEKASTVSWELPNNPGHKGTFGNLTSTIDFDKAKLEGSKITASIEVKTVNAGDPKLNSHLLTADFLTQKNFRRSLLLQIQLSQMVILILLKEL